MNLEELAHTILKTANERSCPQIFTVAVLDESEASDNRLFPVVEVRFVEDKIAFVINEDIAPPS